jgi:hypothetical protein
MAWQGQEDVESLKMLRTNIGKASRLYIFGWVIQDHIESIGKSNTIKRGWGFDYDSIAQMLSDIAPKLSNTYPLHSYPKP